MSDNIDNIHATGAPGVLHLDDMPLVICQPTPRQSTEILEEARRQCKAKLKSPLEAIAASLSKLPPEYRQAAIDAAVREQIGSSDGLGEPTESEIYHHQFTPTGVAYRIWVLARDTQKNLTLEDVQKKVKTQEDATKYLADLGRIAGLDASEKKNGDD